MSPAPALRTLGLPQPRPGPTLGPQRSSQTAVALERGCGTCLLVPPPAPGPWATPPAPGGGYPPHTPCHHLSLTHSLNGEVKGQHRRQRGRGLTQQVHNPHAACAGRGLVVGGDQVVPFWGGRPPLTRLPSPPLTPSTAPNPDLRGTHGQSRLGLCPCPPGSPAGLCPGAPLQADKGDTAWLSHQPRSGPKRKTWRTARASCPRNHISTPQQPHWVPAQHGWGTEAQSSKVARLQAHRGRGESQGAGAGRRAGCPESGEARRVTPITVGPQISEPQFPLV